jgi:phage replication-related protein YjqB (UPF0714/DUF867 family)
MREKEYKNFAELAQKERKKDYRPTIVDRQSQTAVIAIHGGGIERGTSELAEAIATDTYSLYRFEGLKKKEGNGVLHIKSTNFDEPVCAALVARSEKVLSVHGLKGKKHMVYVGGLDEALRTRILQSLTTAGFDAKEDTTGHSAKCGANICNRGLSAAGVQLEITKGLRDAILEGPQLLSTFVGAIRDALQVE